MEYSKSLVLFCMLYFLIINDIETFSIQIYPDKDGILGPSNLQVRCDYILGIGETVSGSNIQAKFNNKFVDIASFEKDSNGPAPIFISAGNYLSSRATLFNPTPSLPNTVIIKFNQIECEDEREYKCKASLNTDGSRTLPESNATSINVKGKPAKPDNVPTWIPESEIEEGTNVTFTCTGNVGKPAGKFKWTKYRGTTPTVYNDSTTTTVKMPGTCTFNGTSMLTIELEAEDNNASIKCEVEQELATSEMFQQSQPDELVVLYKVRNIGITKSPNLLNYAEGATSITLECSAEGNPTPNFTWHKDSDMNTTLATGKTYTLSQNDVIVNNTGNYVCVAYNIVNGIRHELTEVQHIQIDYATTPSPTTTPSTTVTDPNVTNVPPTNNDNATTPAPTTTPSTTVTDPNVTNVPPTNNEDPQRNTGESSLGIGSIVGIGVVLLCAIVIIVIVIVWRRKRRHQKDESIDEPTEKPRNNPSYVEKQDDLGDQNKPINNQMNYADLSFEDRPRGQRPLQVSQDVELNQVIYAEVVKSRV